MLDFLSKDKFYSEEKDYFGFYLMKVNLRLCVQKKQLAINEKQYLYKFAVVEMFLLLTNLISTLHYYYVWNFTAKLILQHLQILVH